MPRVLLDEDIQPLSEFRANVASYIEKVRKTRRPLVITKRGKSAAVMIDVSEYEALLEKIEILSDVQQAEAQIDRGEGLNHKSAQSTIVEKIKK